MGAAGRGVERVAYRESFQLIESRRSSFMPSRYPAIDPNSLVKKKRKGRGQIVTMKRLAGPQRQQFNTAVFQSRSQTSFFFVLYILLLIVALNAKKGMKRSPTTTKVLKQTKNKTAGNWESCWNQKMERNPLVFVLLLLHMCAHDLTLSRTS